MSHTRRGSGYRVLESKWWHVTWKQRWIKWLGMSCFYFIGLQ